MIQSPVLRTFYHPSLSLAAHQYTAPPFECCIKIINIEEICVVICYILLYREFIL